jgi:hypothetical protein
VVAGAEVDPASVITNLVAVGSEVLAVEIQLDAIVPDDRERYGAIVRTFVDAPFARCE